MRVHQVHGADILSGAPATRRSPRCRTADIIVSNDPAVATAIQTADCVPILLADRRTGAVAAAHAGWRGLAAGVPRVAVDALAREFGSRPADLVAAAGPSIGACCYEVGADVRQRFDGSGMARRRRSTDGFSSGRSRRRVILRWRDCARSRDPDHWYFDSGRAARATSSNLPGVPRDQIFVAELCTASHPGVLCSYRRDGTGAGRMAAAIRARRST